MSTYPNATLTPEGRRRLWDVGKNAVSSRNRVAVAQAKGRLRGLGVAPMLKAAICTHDGLSNKLTPERDRKG